jgi:anti-sigma factor RsiW
MARNSAGLGCERAHALISLRLDSESSPLEERQLTRHLASCAACRSYARDLDGISGALRASPPVAADFVVEMPRRRRLTPLNVQAVAAVAAVAFLGATFALSAPGSQRRGSSLGSVRADQRPAYLDSPSYEQSLLRDARQAHEQQSPGKVIAV